ncbi:50S ribosomal protein L29 [Candidatus Peregrinibacteria bacterium]|nr:50S ribosomal protein L29 [Candidatus Peregrinibacteria bacterium]
MYTLEELKKMKPEQINKTLSEPRKNLTKEKFEARTGQAKDNHKVELARKVVARILTILNQPAK